MYRFLTNGWKQQLKSSTLRETSQESKVPMWTISQGGTAGLAIVNGLDGGKQEANLNDSIKAFEETQNKAYIRFHPEVKEENRSCKTIGMSIREP